MCITRPSFRHILASSTGAWVTIFVYFNVSPCVCLHVSCSNVCLASYPHHVFQNAHSYLLEHRRSDQLWEFYPQKKVGLPHPLWLKPSDWVSFLWPGSLEMAHRARKNAPFITFYLEIATEIAPTQKVDKMGRKSKRRKRKEKRPAPDRSKKPTNSQATPKLRILWHLNCQLDGFCG